MSEHEWVHVTTEQLEADPELVEAIQAFRAPPTDAGADAERWLKKGALNESETIATYVLLVEGEVAAFYSLKAAEVELSTRHRKSVGEASHPSQGAVLIVWLARAAEADVRAVDILRHATGIAQIYARHLGAAAIAVDPYDGWAEDFWRKRFGFRGSRTTITDASGEKRPRLWQPLFPES